MDQLIDFLKNSSWLSGLGQAVTAIMLVYLAIVVHKYTKKRDKLDFFFNSWEQAQEINVCTLSDEKSLIAFEKIVYGQDYEVNAERARKFFCYFLIINRIQNYYFAKSNKIITQSEFDAMVLPTIRLICRDKDMLTFLINNRGYCPDFIKLFTKLLENSEPYDRSPLEYK